MGMSDSPTFSYVRRAQPSTARLEFRSEQGRGSQSCLNVYDRNLGAALHHAEKVFHR